jgi:hypothetical protein
MLNSEDIYLIEYVDSKNNYSKRIVTNNEKYFSQYFEELNKTSVNKSRKTHSPNNTNIPLIIMASEKKGEKLELTNNFRSLDKEKIKIINSINIEIIDFKENFEDLYNFFKDKNNEDDTIEIKFLELSKYIKNNKSIQKEVKNKQNKEEKIFLKMNYKNSIDTTSEIKFY